MKNQYRIGGFVASIAAGLLFANTAIAHEAGKANDSYVGAAGGGGHYITDSSGNCVRTGSWKAEDMTVDCGAEPPKAEAPPPAPAPAPAAPSYETVSVSAQALFDINKADLKPAGQQELDGVIDKINTKGASVIDIDVVGHTDSTGTEEYNQQLSLRRATTVKDYLVSHGIDASIIDVSGKGESQPVADNRTTEGRAQNRRVEVSIGVKQQTN
jgi:OOP family OmpA-OmpF porin